MSKPRPLERKALLTVPMINVKTLFSAMAYDLKLHNESRYIDAYSLLANGKYREFICRIDEWTAQMYQSDGDILSRLHQLAALVSKYPFKDPSVDRDRIAITKFLKSEHKCARMNQKFFLRRSRFEPAHMQHMRRWIENVIGREPNYEDIFNLSDFGPGSSIGTHGAQTSFAKKLERLTVTPGCLPVALTALTRNTHYIDILLSGSGYPKDAQLLERFVSCTQVQYNKIVCVPKNAKTNRTIAIEPALNGYVQKGIDLVLRRKLFRSGIDLSKQALNQSLARLGSLYGSYATIDLSAASDSISIQLVKELLPPEWFTLLNRTRSPGYQLPDGTEARYEKFCSMGNGFCFPLETLIFSAACDYVMNVCALNRNEIFSVYGDDIIIPQECALLLLEVLHDLGFAVNRDKTFIHGGFRESCGADFFFGKNVRPVYIKKELKLDHSVYPLLNELRRRNCLNTWQVLFTSLNKHYQSFTRPYPREDDSAIDVPKDVFMSSRHARWSKDLQAWTWKGLTVSSAHGVKPKSVYELMAGKLRGDLSHTETFSARFSERTRSQLKN